MILTEFKRVGHDLCNRGLVSYAGNLSIRLNDRLVITRRGCNLGCLEENDLIETGIDKNDRFTPLASVELPVHRAIYQKSSALAIVHAHPPYAIAQSLVKTEIVGNCGECSPELEKISVLGWNMEVKPGGLADIIANALSSSRIIMVHGHGSFSTGHLLEEASSYTTMLEECCKVLCVLKSLQVTPPQE